MLKDFYFRGPSDPNYVDGILEISSEIEELVYQLKMIILTNKTEVLGDSNFGANQADMLFSTSSTTGALMVKAMTDQINTYSEMARAYSIDIDGKRIQDPQKPNRDLIFLDMKINGKSAFGIIL